jgi:hypothetical protein
MLAPAETGTFSDTLAGVVRYFGFNPSGNVETFQLILGLFAALVAYLLIHRSQIAAASEGRKLERNRLLDELNHEYFRIMARRCVVKAQGAPEATCDPERMLELENVLVRGVTWNPAKLADADGNGYRTINQSRYMRICKDYWVDSMTLHLMLLWTKRVHHGLQSKVLSPEDVVEMWRNILPWAKNNRFSFMASWFGSEPGPVAAPELSLPGWGWLDRALWRLKTAVLGWAGTSNGSMQRLLGLKPPLKAQPPAQWKGDIASLYHLIYVVTDQAIRTRRADILGYANPSYTADNAPAGSRHAVFDQRLRENLLR